MLYNVSINGLCYINADSSEEAIEIVKKEFYDGNLTIDDLWVSIDEEIEEED